MKDLEGKTMKSIFYEDLDKIENSKRKSTVEFSLWVPGMDLIHFGPITMTERQWLEARLTVVTRSNDPVKTSSYFCTRDLFDVLDTTINHAGGDDRVFDSSVVSYLDPLTNPTVEQVKKKKWKQEQEQVSEPDPEQEPATAGSEQQGSAAEQ